MCPWGELVADRQIPHMFLSPTSHVAARIWTPCVDSLWERCTWELEFTVPHTLPDRIDLPPFTVVSSGELMEQVSSKPLPELKLMSDNPSSQPKQDHLLLPPSQPDYRPAYPIRSRSIRNAAHPPRREKGDDRILSTRRSRGYGKLNGIHV